MACFTRHLWNVLSCAEKLMEATDMRKAVDNGDSYDIHIRSPCRDFSTGRRCHSSNSAYGTRSGTAGRIVDLSADPVACKLTRRRTSAEASHQFQVRTGPLKFLPLTSGMAMGFTLTVLTRSQPVTNTIRNHHSPHSANTESSTSCYFYYLQLVMSLHPQRPTSKGNPGVVAFDPLPVMLRPCFPRRTLCTRLLFFHAKFVRSQALESIITLPEVEMSLVPGYVYGCRDGPRCPLRLARRPEIL